MIKERLELRFNSKVINNNRISHLYYKEEWRSNIIIGWIT
jgi:hypothetical protein